MRDGGPGGRAMHPLPATAEADAHWTVPRPRAGNTGPSGIPSVIRPGVPDGFPRRYFLGHTPPDTATPRLQGPDNWQGVEPCQLSWDTGSPSYPMGGGARGASGVSLFTPHAPPGVPHVKHTQELWLDTWGPTAQGPVRFGGARRMGGPHRDDPGAPRPGRRKSGGLAMENSE